MITLIYAISGMYEFMAVSLAQKEAWVSAIQRVITRSAARAPFVVTEGKVVFDEGPVFDLASTEDKLNLLQLRECPCGAPTDFLCSCMVQGYCSKVCEGVHRRFHQSNCLRRRTSSSTSL